MTDKQTLINYLLQLGDNSLILGHRLSEWCGHGPELETDLALTNIALDLTGQARALYQRVAELEGKGRTEDDIAFLRNAWEYRNVLLVELPNGDFGQTIVRQFLMDTWNLCLYRELCKSADTWLAGFAGKSLKEVTYHHRFSREWMLRLGDGTDFSKSKIQNALEKLWNYSGELSTANETELRMTELQIAPNLDLLKEVFDAKVEELIQEANLIKPADSWMQSGGKQGIHTEHLGFILAEMQFLQRAYPGLEW